MPEHQDDVIYHFYFRNFPRRYRQLLSFIHNVKNTPCAHRTSTLLEATTYPYLPINFFNSWPDLRVFACHFFCVARFCAGYDIYLKRIGKVLLAGIIADVIGNLLEPNGWFANNAYACPLIIRSGCA